MTIFVCGGWRRVDSNESTEASVSTGAQLSLDHLYEPVREINRAIRDLTHPAHFRYDPESQDAESDTDIAFVLHEHACAPLDREIERIESLVALCLRRLKHEEVR